MAVTPPIRPTLRGMVFYHWHLGWTRERSRQRVLTVLGSGFSRRFTTAWEALEADVRRARLFERRAPTSRLDPTGLCARGRDATAFRVGVRISFDNPREHRRQVMGLIFDLPTGLTREEMTSNVRGRILDYLSQFYQIRREGRGGLSSRVRDITFTTIEGIC